MKKLIDWLKESNRYKHLLGGAVIGIISNDWYCATISGVGIASALEYKDKAHGCVWDWYDWILTVLGTAIGFGIRSLIF